MNAPIVVDVGNTRIKWGRGDQHHVSEIAILDPDDPAAWKAQWQAWGLQPGQPWIVSGVHPRRRDLLTAWLRSRCDAVHVMTSHQQLPLQVHVEAPDRVGIDRLLNAVAINRRRQPDSAAVAVDLGSAVTVDLVDVSGAFRGGAIFPGLRLMAQALHDHTAALPFVAVTDRVAPPGNSTVRAIQAGVYHAVLGGIERLIHEYQGQQASPLEVYLTGGDAEHFAPAIAGELWPTMTLEGILHSRPG